METVYLSALQEGSQRRGTQRFASRECIYGTTYQGMAILVYLIRVKFFVVKLYLKSIDLSSLR